MPDPVTIADAKKALRKQALAQRALIDPSTEAEAARDGLIDLIERQAIDIAEDASVSGYIAMKGELDPRPALQALEKRGCTLLLPYTQARGEPLRFLEAPGGEATGRDAFGIAANPSGSY